MPNTYFQFKEFRVDQKLSGMKVTTDACLFGAWVANEIVGRNPSQILDIGAGTGLLSLMLAQTNQNTTIDAVEINSDAFNEATSNFNQSPWSKNLTCFHSSVQDFSSDQYDLIICNPPFFKKSQLGKEHNKNQALHSTLLSESQLIKTILRLLSGKGVCYLLYPEQEMHRFINVAQEYGLHPKKLITVKNKEGGRVFRIMAAFGYDKSIPAKFEIIIRKEDGRYTSQFWDYLNEYYLDYNAPEKS